MPYIELVKEAFHMVRHNRYLWFYGLFAGGASFNFSVPADTSGGGSGDGGPSIEPGVVVAIAAVVFVLFVVFVALNVLSQGGLADSVAAIKRGEPRRFGTTWRAGLRSFWRVLGLFVLVGLAAFALVVAVLLPVVLSVLGAVAMGDGALPIAVAAIATGFPALIILIGLFIVLGVTVQFATRHLVLAQARIVESIRAGWRLVRDNLIPSGAMLLIQQAASFVGSIVIALVVVLLCLPAIILLVAGAETVGIVSAVLTGLIVIPLALTAYGALGAFNHSLWTLSYLWLRPHA